jgi:hypothetical protein
VRRLLTVAATTTALTAGAAPIHQPDGHLHRAQAGPDPATGAPSHRTDTAAWLLLRET